MNRPKNHINELGLEIGYDVSDWAGAKKPGLGTLKGQYCRCEPLNLNSHSAGLFNAFEKDRDNLIWVYLPYGPFENLTSFQQWMQDRCFTGDPYFYAIIDIETECPLGVASYLRINPDAGSIEVGHINFSPGLQNTIAATEAMYLMIKNVFQLGYRRYEWKCNALNSKSRNAALRLGFTFEGISRQMQIVKGRNRDTAWYSVLDLEWPALKNAFECWLHSNNFDQNGRQRQSLSALTRALLD